jgi:hypothetical protein
MVILDLVMELKYVISMDIYIYNSFNPPHSNPGTYNITLTAKYPKSFLNKPCVKYDIISCHSYFWMDSMNADIIGAATINSSNYDKDKIYIEASMELATSDQSLTGGNMELNYIAIGKWK